MGSLHAATRSPAHPSYERHRPEKTTLYELVRDNIETLYGAIDDGALAVKIPKHASANPITPPAEASLSRHGSTQTIVREPIGQRRGFHAGSKGEPEFDAKARRGRDAPTRQASFEKLKYLATLRVSEL